MNLKWDSSPKIHIACALMFIDAARWNTIISEDEREVDQKSLETKFQTKMFWENSNCSKTDQLIYWPFLSRLLNLTHVLRILLLILSFPSSG